MKRERAATEEEKGKESQKMGKSASLQKTGETDLDDGLYGVQCAGTTPD